MKEKHVLARHKICPNCLIEYCSLNVTAYRTKKEVCCCKVCQNEYGVKTRKKNGSYIVTEDQILKNKQTHLLKNPDYGKKAEKLAHDKAQRNLTYDKTIYSHWSQDPKNKVYLSEINKNKSFDNETRRKMSESRKRLFATHPDRVYTNANGGKRTDLNNIYFRSNWEANYARILNNLQIDWQYEASSFLLSNGKYYIPDFKLSENKYVELKGWWDNDSKEKIKLFLAEYPSVELEIINEDSYKSLRNLFKTKINWEGK